VLMHRDDLELYRNLEMQAEWIGFKAPQMTEVDDFLQEAARSAGRYELRVIHTPATRKAASACICRARRIVANHRAGNSLCGRHALRRQHRAHRFVGGSFEEIMRSLRARC